MKSVIYLLTSLYILIICLVDGKETPVARNRVPELYPDVYTGFGAKPAPLLSFDELPREFNWCAKPDGGCTASWNQHIPQYFPLCYLHASLSMAQDRIRHMISGYGIPDITLSRQDILDCGSHFGFGQDDGGGGEVVDVLEYMHQVGIPDDTCNIFQGVPKTCVPDARCMNCMMLQNDNMPHCWPVEKYVRYYAKEYGFVRGEQEMMSEIYQRGPITCGLALNGEDFTFGYKGGVHVDKTNATDVDHEIEVVGWTEAPHPDPSMPSGTKIRSWIIRNSWGTYVGHNGFAFIERGTNTMRIEERCTFALFDITELENHLRGQNVGSMFGLVQRNEEPRMFPRGWNNMKHDFMTKEEIEQEARQVEKDDAWIDKHVVREPLQLRGSVIYPENTPLKTTKTIKSDTETSEKPKPVKHKVTTIMGLVFLSLAFVLGMIIMVLYAHCTRSEGYDDIPITIPTNLQPTNPINNTPVNDITKGYLHSNSTSHNTSMNGF